MTMRRKNRRHVGPLPSAALMVTLSMIVLSGCAIQPSQTAGQQAFHRAHPGKALNDTLNGFLSHASPGEVITLANSPWGAEAIVTAERGYFAASGRHCRPLKIETPLGGGRHALACRTPQGWVAQRLVTDSPSTEGHSR